ncbi:hypothetical protein OAQ99_07785, partial [Candidatus Kapabacteria bacterium]|nr:hypothetical protein [Candidatus Kapabacteria bacterium]
MKLFTICILLISVTLNAQTFDSPRDLLKGIYKEPYKFRLLPGLSYKYHTINNSDFKFLDKPISELSISSYGVALRFDFGQGDYNHAFNLNANYGSKDFTLKTNPTEIITDGVTSFYDYPSTFAMNFINLDFTYHYYLFAQSFSLFAGPSVYLFNEFELNDNNWTSRYDSDTSLEFIEGAN